jgi:hypothetical protein
MNLFAQNCVNVIADWISLLGKTTLPGDLASSDPLFIDAFKAVDWIIRGKEGTYLLRRLAYVQLMQIFTLLESIIRSERENGRASREPCYRDATIAINIYMKAQEDLSHPDALRRELKERKRAGRSWSDLAGQSSPLFTMIYSEAAESIVYGLTPPRKFVTDSRKAGRWKTRQRMPKVGGGKRHGAFRSGCSHLHSAHRECRMGCQVRLFS